MRLPYGEYLGLGSGKQRLDPNLLRPQLGGGLPGPIAVGKGRSRTGMKNLGELQRQTFGGETGASRRKFANADDPFRLENLQDTPQMLIANARQGVSLGL